MKKMCILFVAVLFTATSFSQTITDGLRYASEGSFGTARFQAMSGAFGALGGDFSAMNINPAGSSVFLSSAGTISFGVNDTENNIEFVNSGNTTVDTDVNLNQLGAVFVLHNPDESSHWKKLTIGLNYDVMRNYSNEIRVQGANTNSIGNFFVEQANGIPLSLLQTQPGETVSDLYSFLGSTQGTAAQNALLGFQSFIIDPANPDDIENQLYISNAIDGNLNTRYSYVSEGENAKGTLNFATQYKDWLHLGVNLSSHQIDFFQNAVINENNLNPESTIQNIAFENTLATIGSGFSAQIGAIATYKNFRVGLALDTPTWYNIREETTQRIETQRFENDILVNTLVSPNVINFFEEYNLRTPGKIGASAAYVFGKTGIISFDYSIKDFGNLKFDSNFNNDAFFDAQNQLITNNLQAASSFKMGGEYRIGQWSLRGGLRYDQSPYKNEEIMSDLSGFSGGFGYNFGRFNFDVSYARTSQDRTQNIYASNNSLTIDEINNTFGISFSCHF